MDQHLLQHTRYLLQKRFGRIRSANTGSFELVAQQVLVWLENHPILGPILHQLDELRGDHYDEIQLLLNWDSDNSSRYYYITTRKQPRNESEPPFKGYTPVTLEEHAAACLQILRAAIKRPSLEFYAFLATYLTQEDYDKRLSKDPMGAIKDIAVRDLHEYLDERLDDINAVNGLLRKYQQYVEWFQREFIREIAEQGYLGKSGERALASHLQEYIFNQGVEFVIEPSSTSGEVDLLLRSPSGQYTIIDAKYIKPNSSESDIRRKIAEGFNQVARYCTDYLQPEGFLAVFVNDDVSILIDVEQHDAFKSFKIGGSIIYYIEINISERRSASKAGKAKQVHITRDELIQKIEEIQN